MGNKISFSKFYTQFNVLNSYCFYAFDDATDLALNCLHYQPVQFFQKPEVSLHGVFSIVYLIGAQNRNCYTMLPTKNPALSNAMVTAWIALKYKPLVTLPGLDNSSQAKKSYIDLLFSPHNSISMIPDLHLIMYFMPMATVLSCLLN